MKNIEVHNLGQIAHANIELGDFTVFIGPQASGKSILLQMMKLAVDSFSVKDTIKKYGFDWNSHSNEFIQLFLGEGMSGIVTDKTSIYLDKKEFLIDRSLKAKRGKQERLFLIPAQRVMSILNGWPKNFLS